AITIGGQPMQMNEPLISGRRALSVSFLWINELSERQSCVDRQHGEGRNLDPQKPESKAKMALQGELYRLWTLEEILGSSEELRQKIADLQNLAQTSLSILITGENGVGKEVVASFLHEFTRRSPQALVHVNCAAVSP